MDIKLHGGMSLGLRPIELMRQLTSLQEFSVGLNGKALIIGGKDFGILSMSVVCF